MSVVRYNNESHIVGSGNSNQLSIVHRNDNSNSLVVYNAGTNSFQVVKLDGSGIRNESNHQRRRSSFDFSSRRGSFSSGRSTFEFICANCGYINRFSEDRGSHKRHHEHNHDSNSPSSSSTVRAKQLSRGSEEAAIEFSDEDRNEDEDELNAVRRKRRRKSFEHDDPLSNSIVRGYSNEELGMSRNYITTTSGLLRDDYFRILAKINLNHAKSSSRELVDWVASGSGNAEHANQQEDKIPYKLINQGYFTKFFKVIKLLGNGSNGKVYQVEHELLGLNLGIFALKKIAIGDDVHNLVKILNEVQFLYHLGDKAYKLTSEAGAGNIVRYNHVWLEIDQVTKFGPKVPVIFILYEYCDGGDLMQFIESIANPKFDLKKEKIYRKMRRLSENGGKPVDSKKFHQKKSRYLNNYEIFKIFNDALNGVAYLHKLKIIHRDLKPSNCLFKTKFSDEYEPITSVDQFNRIPTLLVSDFGESIMENTKRTSTGTTGTLEFCAPELFQFEMKRGRRTLKEFTHASDVYSLGMILYYLCFNRLPFKSTSPADVRKEIVKCEMFDGIEKIRSLSSDTMDEDSILPDWIDLIRRMVDPDMGKRPSAPELVDNMRDIYHKLDTNNRNPTYLDGSTSVDEEKATDTENETMNNEEKKTELLAIIDGQSKKCIKIMPRWNTSLVVLVVITFGNVWIFRGWPLVTNLEYLTLGASVNPIIRPYLITLQLAVLASGMGIALGNIYISNLN